MANLLSTSISGTATTSDRAVIGGVFANNAYSSVDSTRLHFGGGDSDANANYYIGTNKENFGGNYTKLDLRWHTGIRMGAAAVYGGIRFFSDQTLATRIMSIGETDANIRIDNNLYIGGAGGWITDLLAAKQNASTAITTGNIGSQSVSFATSAGALTSMNISQFTNNSGYITSVLNLQYGGGDSLTGAGTATTWDPRPGPVYDRYVIGNHTGISLHGYPGYGGVRLYSAGYPTLTTSVLRLEASDAVYTFGGLYSDGRAVIHTGNIGSQSVNYAASAGNADTVDSLHASSFVRNDTTRQYLKPYFEYSEWLTTQSPLDLVNQMGGGGFRVDFLHPSYTANGNWGHIMTWSGYNGYTMYQMSGSYGSGADVELYVRNEANHERNAWSSWRRLLHDNNYNSYSPTLTGTGASGTWGISITGNANTATTAGSAPNAGNINPFYNVTAGIGNGLRFWSGDDSYKISMGVGSLYQYGPVIDYSIKTQMDPGSTGRGFTWGNNGVTPVAALNATSGNFQVAGTIANGSVWINNGANYNNYDENIRLFDAPNGVSVIAFSASGTGGSPKTSILGFSSYLETRVSDTWEQRIYGGYVEARGSMRAPIFYDSQDTAYYGDFGSTSRFNATITNTSYFGADTNKGYAQGFNTYSSSLHKIAYVSFDWNGNYDAYSNHGIASTDFNGNFADSVSINSYNDITFRLDSNNNNGDSYVRFMNDTTGNNTFSSIGYNGSTYYASFSRDLYVTGNTGGSFGNRLIIGATTTPHTLQDANVRPTAYLRGPYPVLTLDHTETNNGEHGPTIQFTFNGSNARQWVIGCGGSGNHMDFGFSSSGYGNTNYNPHNGISGYLGNTIMRIIDSRVGIGGDWGAYGSVANPEHTLDVRGTIFSNTDMRAPIFYDSNNTGYYGDFASTSVMNAIRLGTSTNNGTISGGGDWGIRFANDNGYIQFGPANGSWTHIYSDKNFYFNQELYVNGALVVKNSSSPSFSTVYSNWFRAQGSTGFYFESYGSGITDAGVGGAIYGSINTYGPGISDWPGYAIRNDAIFMARSTRAGIFIPNADSWLIRYEQSVNEAFIDFNLTWGSDVRYKTNIKTIENSLDKVKALRGVTYNYKGAEKTSIGFIAQEMEPIMPEVVSTDADGFKGVGYANIVALLVEAMKEQQTIIDDLKTRINALESK